MESWLQDFFVWLPQGGVYYALLGAIAFLESVTGVGLLVPGSVITVFAGFLTVHGKGEIVPVMAASGAGALLGDLLSFFLGARYGGRLLRLRLLRRRKGLIRRAEIFFGAHGGKSVFFGRFFGPLRGLVPFVAGSARMSLAPFVAYALISAVLWGLAYPGLGFLGGASWRKVQVLTGRFGLVIAVLLALFILNALFWKRAAPRIASTSVRLWVRITEAWGALLRIPSVHRAIGRHPALWRFLADRFTLQRGSGLYLTTGLFASSLFAGLSIWLMGDFPALDRLDLSVYRALGGLRHPRFDSAMAALASLADAPPLLSLALFALTGLILYNRDFSAVILVAGMAGGELIVSFLHAFSGRPAPHPYLPGLETAGGGYPSGETFSVYLLGGLLLYFLLGTIHQWQARLTLVIASSFLVLLVAFSRIYLGLQWTSGALATLALAALWLTFLFTAAELRRRSAGEFPWRIGWQPVRLSPAVRSALLALAGVGAAAGILWHIWQQLQRL